jgi:hypothetical protein
MSVVEKFSLHIQETDDLLLRPVYTEEGITFVYVKCNNLLLLAVTKRNSNIGFRFTNFLKLYAIVLPRGAPARPLAFRNFPRQPLAAWKQKRLPVPGVNNLDFLQVPLSRSEN